MKTLYYVRINQESLEDMLSNGYETSFKRLIKKCKAYKKKHPEDKMQILEYKLVYKFDDLIEEWKPKYK